MTLWTQAEIDHALGLRKIGSTYPEIARAIGRTTESVAHKFKKLKVSSIVRPPGHQAPLPAPQPEQEISCRYDGLPAGHPLTWSLITAGTCLEGMAYGA